ATSRVEKACGPPGGSVRPSRRVLMEMISGLTVLGLATFAFIAPRQPGTGPLPSAPANAVPQSPSASRVPMPAHGPVRDVESTAAQRDSAQGEPVNATAIPPCDKPGG